VQYERKARPRLYRRVNAQIFVNADEGSIFCYLLIACLSVVEDPSFVKDDNKNQFVPGTKYLLLSQKTYHHPTTL
jgi:hypothetical protein